MAGLPPGTYTVTVELAGFQQVKHADLTLAAGAAVPVDVTLKISEVRETVTVVGGAPLVDVKNTQIGKTVDQTFLQNIPVARNFAQVIATAPGVVDSGYLFAPAQSVQGSSVRDSLYNVDGANANDTTVGYAFMEIPYDIIEEVQVTTAGISRSSASRAAPSSTSSRNPAATRRTATQACIFRTTRSRGTT